VNCNASGLRIGPVQLLRRTFFGFESRPLGEIDFLLSKVFGVKLTFAKRMAELDAIAAVLSKGDFAQATTIALFMRLPALSPDQADRARLAERLLKKGYDPNELRDTSGRWTGSGGETRGQPGTNPSNSDRQHAPQGGNYEVAAQTINIDQRITSQSKIRVMSIS
jgi:hypothetical protein